MAIKPNSITLSQTISLNADMTTIEWLPTGDYALNFALTDATSGSVLRSHRWIIRGDGSGLFDESGVLVQAVPASFMTNLASIKTNVDTALTNAATAGKIKL